MDIFALFLISKESIQSFIIKYDISCKFLQIPFIRVRKLESILEQKVQASGKKKTGKNKKQSGVCKKSRISSLVGVGRDSGQ